MTIGTELTLHGARGDPLPRCLLSITMSEPGGARSATTVASSQGQDNLLSTGLLGHLVTNSWVVSAIAIELS
jgi:hypothetical protein